MKTGIVIINRFGDEVYKKTKALGFDCVDFGMSDTETEIYSLPEAESDALMLKQKAMAEEAGIGISQVHGPWRYPPKDDTPEDRAERLDKMKRSIRATAALGCKYWVIHPIMPFGTHDLEIGKEKETWELNLEFFKALLPTAKEYGVTVCLENMPMLDFSISKPLDIIRLVEALNDECFKICLDTGHVTVFRGLSLGEETRRVGKLLKVLHVHDNRASLDMHLPPYFGKGDWADFVLALKEIGYDGVFSLEVAPPHPLPDPIFEKMCSAYADMARWMVRDCD